MAGSASTYAYKIISLLGQYVPDLTSMIVDHEFLTPADVETQYHSTQGHWHHGELSIHQSFMMRPVHGAAQYDTPVENLFVCGAGCHPGGGVTGLLDGPLPDGSSNWGVQNEHRP